LPKYPELADLCATPILLDPKKWTQIQSTFCWLETSLTKNLVAHLKTVDSQMFINFYIEQYITILQAFIAEKLKNSDSLKNSEFLRRNLVDRLDDIQMHVKTIHSCFTGITDDDHLSEYSGFRNIDFDKNFNTIKNLKTWLLSLDVEEPTKTNDELVRTLETALTQKVFQKASRADFRGSKKSNWAKIESILSESIEELEEAIETACLAQK
jgi:hypothetical protein